MKQIRKQKELIGKTIAQVIIPKEHYRKLWMKFTDSSFVVFDVNDISTGFNSSEYVMVIEDCDVDKTESNLLKLGLITPQEHAYAVQLEEIEREERNAKHEKEEEEWLIARDVELLKNLQKKYSDLNLDKDD